MLNSIVTNNINSNSNNQGAAIKKIVIKPKAFYLHC